MPHLRSEQKRARKSGDTRPARADRNGHSLHDLQRLAGNAAVTALVEEGLKVERQGATAPPVAAPAAAAVAPPTLKQGDTGPEVVDLQKKMNDLGAALTEDGNFGWRTKAAVTSLQTDVGIKVSGTVDADTWTAITTAKPGSVKAVGLGRQQKWKSWIPWSGLRKRDRQDWTTLGWNAATWKSKTPPAASSKKFRALTDAERAAAVRLGYTPASWDARRDVTAANAAAAYAEEEARAKARLSIHRLNQGILVDVRGAGRKSVRGHRIVGQQLRGALIHMGGVFFCKGLPIHVRLRVQHLVDFGVDGLTLNVEIVHPILVEPFQRTIRRVGTGAVETVVFLSHLARGEYFHLGKRDFRVTPELRVQDRLRVK